jgi:acyl carrier protein
MAILKQQVLTLIYEGIDEINEQFSGAARLAKSPDNPLVGKSGALDSLGFVNLIAAIEERCEEWFSLRFIGRTAFQKIF